MKKLKDFINEGKSIEIKFKELPTKTGRIKKILDNNNITYILSGVSQAGYRMIWVNHNNLNKVKNILDNNKIIDYKLRYVNF